MKQVLFSLDDKKFNEYLSNMSDAYYENGYLTTAIIPEPYKDDDLRQISYLIHIQENKGGKTWIENLKSWMQRRSQN